MFNLWYHSLSENASLWFGRRKTYESIYFTNVPFLVITFQCRGSGLAALYWNNNQPSEYCWEPEMLYYLYLFLKGLSDSLVYGSLCHSYGSRFQRSRVRFPVVMQKLKVLKGTWGTTYSARGFMGNKVFLKMYPYNSKIKCILSVVSNRL